MQGAQAKQKKSYNLQGFKILVVEDYPFMTDLIASMLREFGVGHILTAENGLEAQEILMLFNSSPGRENMIDFVITDWLMPESDGLDLMNWIRGNKKDTIRFLPIILCSAYTSTDVVKKGRDHGANEVLVKPVSAQKLASRILYVIDNPRPYVKAPGYFGPDRRRKIEAFKGEEKRVAEAESIKEYHERI